MFSKEESAQLRKEFWTSFGKSFPRKWLLYNTKIKGLAFKFVATKRYAFVCLDIESNDKIQNKLLYEQLLSIKNILLTEYLKDAIFDDAYELENRKTIHRVYVIHKEKFSIHNKNTWRDCYVFFIEEMSKFELFFDKYKNTIQNEIL